MKFLLLLATLSFITNSSAGFKKGNGGNILKCNTGPNVVLDYYEMIEYHKLNFSSEFNNPQLFFENAANRLVKIDEQFAKQFDLEFTDLGNRLKFIDVAEMGKVDDAYVTLLPSDCELKQTAILLYPRILLSKPTFQTLNPIQKNILLLHEVIYSAMISNRKLDDSRPVRALVALVLSQELNSMSMTEIKSFLQKNNL